MTKEAIDRVTLACLNDWIASLTDKSYTQHCKDLKALGMFWGADETLDDSPNVV